MVKIVDNHGRELVKVHVLNIFQDKCVYHLSELADFCQKYGVFLDIWASF